LARGVKAEGDSGKINFADVVGAEEAKTELVEIVDFKNPSRFTQIGARIQRVLLVGPPGTGEAGAVAEKQVFRLQFGSEFVELFVVGSSRCAILFEQAKNKLLHYFIDELDAICKSRAAMVLQAVTTSENNFNQLLTEMDGFKGATVIVRAATNRPES